MIVVINPSDKAGHSFKGLHAYAAHDTCRRSSAERVEWIDTRNIDAEPAHAWKLMANTARMQNELKKAFGQRAGRAAKEGAVLHVILAFDVDEPQDEAAMKSAADEFLAQYGKTKRLKSGTRKHYADQHQTIMYAHNDGKNGAHHLHLMINKVHPETGLNLPDGNDRIKAQNWAEKYSSRHGTEHKTPARQENRAERERGEYVTQPRLAKNVYELEQKLKAKVANDRDPLKLIRESQKRKDHRLFKIGRALDAQRFEAENALYAANQARITALQDQMKRDIRTQKGLIREQWRPLHRALQDKQRQEQRTFDAMEASFFGRMGNTVKSISQSFRDNHKNIIGRSFNIAKNAADREAAFHDAQERSRKALERARTLAELEAAERQKAAHRANMAANHAFFERKRAELVEFLNAKRDKLQQLWQLRAVQRNKESKKIDRLLTTREAAQQISVPVKRVFNRAARPLPRIQTTGDERIGSDRRVDNDAAKPPSLDRKKSSVAMPSSSRLAAFKAKQLPRGVQAFRDVMQRPATEQDNDRER